MKLPRIDVTVELTVRRLLPLRLALAEVADADERADHAAGT